jgi:hypothetical protein
VVDGSGVCNGSSVDPRLPEFLGIGALKAATTYLEGLLREHPDLCLPRNQKEVQFFNRYFERGPKWYAAVFASCGGRRRGEISPQYLSDPLCPSRIARLLPDVRLLVSLRDPVQRAYSQYKHWVQERGYGESFEDFIDDHPAALERGEYFRLLSRYLDLFPFERMHVVLAEDLMKSPQPVMGAVFEFLGVDPASARDVVGRPENVSTVPRFHPVYVRAKRITRWLYQREWAGVVHTAKRLGVPRLFRASGRAGAFPPLTPATSARLRQHYSEDVANLSRLLGRDMAAYWWGAAEPDVLVMAN